MYAEETDEAVIVYIYDQNGSPMGFQYHGADYADGVWDGYAYEKNMFGDIVAVYDVSTGLKLISYTYDVWGTCTKTTYYNSGDTTSAINNPYRYRGYYYDEDLCMYYLQSRYYDPVVCRFISPDSLMSGANGSLHGYNLYAYCFNNPISYTDSEGEWPLLICLAIKMVVTNHIINAIMISQVDKELEEDISHQDAKDMIEEITGEGTVVWKNVDLHITDSVSVKSRYQRIKISQIAHNARNGDGSDFTDRSVYNLSAEWLGHNVVNAFYDTSQTRNVDLDSDFKENSPLTKFGTIALMIVGFL